MQVWNVRNIELFSSVVIIAAVVSGFLGNLFVCFVRLFALLTFNYELAIHTYISMLWLQVATSCFVVPLYAIIIGCVCVTWWKWSGTFIRHYVRAATHCINHKLRTQKLFHDKCDCMQQQLYMQHEKLNGFFYIYINMHIILLVFHSILLFHFMFATTHVFMVLPSTLNTTT